MRQGAWGKFPPVVPFEETIGQYLGNIREVKGVLGLFLLISWECLLAGGWGRHPLIQGLSSEEGENVTAACRVFSCQYL